MVLHDTTGAGLSKRGARRAGRFYPNDTRKDRAAGARSWHFPGTPLAPEIPCLLETTIVLANKLPDYHDAQSAFQNALRVELDAALDRLSLPPDARVLDAPCGDGFHARNLAKRLGPSGRLTLADASNDFLDAARQTLAGVDTVPLEFIKADIYSLAFPDHHFDLAWCAQSLITLVDPTAVLKELARVTRAGGIVAVLESDEFHRLLLPWPVDLELAIHLALQEASRKKYADRGRLAPARRVRRQLLDAGLRSPRKHSITADRQAPFDPATSRLLKLELESLADFVQPYLSAAERERFARFIDPDASDSVHHRPDAELTCLAVLHVARTQSSVRPVPQAVSRQ